MTFIYYCNFKTDKKGSNGINVTHTVPLSLGGTGPLTENCLSILKHIPPYRVRSSHSLGIVGPQTWQRDEEAIPLSVLKHYEYTLMTIISKLHECIITI